MVAFLGETVGRMEGGMKTGDGGGILAGGRAGVVRWFKEAWEGG